MMPFSFAFSRRGDQGETRLSSGKEFRFDIEEYVRYFSKPIPPRLVDLLRIAAAIYFTDRLVRRKQRKQQRYWSRSLALKVKVNDAEFWTTPEIQELLIEAIEFLSDDRWNFTFEQDDHRPATVVQGNLFKRPEHQQVVLASGGLDSAAGLGVQLANEPSTVRLPVTVWHQPIQRKVVLQQHRLLSARFESLADPLIIKTALIWTPELKRFRQESSQRGRAFLFTAAGAVAAAMIGSSSVDVLESGVGAINLPLMAGMVGSRTTRSCHPEFHRRMARLVSEVCGHRVTFFLPFFDRTKGEVVKELTDRGLGELSHLTVSCVHYPLRESRHKQCGVCPACILRRQSLAVAGVQEQEETYKFDLFDSSQNANNVPRKQRKYLHALLSQVVQLEDIQSALSLPPLIRRHLFGTGIVSAEHPVETATQVLRTYRNEWMEFIAQAKSRGISWTNLVASGDDATEGVTRAIA
ncbi:MAG: 7-cyano-7-deazaguanine synthase [Pirellulaceae bacterium]